MVFLISMNTFMGLFIQKNLIFHSSELMLELMCSHCESRQKWMICECSGRVKRWRSCDPVTFHPAGARRSRHRHRGLSEPGGGAAGGRGGWRPRVLHQGLAVPPDVRSTHGGQHGPSRPRAHGVHREREHGEEHRAAPRQVTARRTLEGLPGIGGFGDVWKNVFFKRVLFL